MSELDGETAWRQLIERYADGRKPCNCGEAYYDETGHCKWGCSANLIYAKREIAQRVTADLAAAEKRGYDDGFQVGNNEGYREGLEIGSGEE